MARMIEIDFDPEAYLANYAGLRAAFGEDGDAAALHHIRRGRDEGRLTEDALLHVASDEDLLEAA